MTVQETLERAFSLVLRTSVPLTFAGRTDAGVHAEEMYAHFDLEKPLDDTQQFVGRLNRILPDDIALFDIRPVTSDAHARFSAISRTYEYRTHTAKSPFRMGLYTRVPSDLDFDAMNNAARALIGTQDFASFCRMHTDVKTTICTLTHAEWKDGVFTITANRFLRNMVRAIVGTLFEVGRHKMTSEQFAEVILKQSRPSAGQSAPSEGLFLTNIDYPKDIWK